jgi:hypothetical protein
MSGFDGGLSIIVPCGRPETARGTVESILGQDWLPPAYELILAGVAVEPLMALCKGRATAVAVCLPERRNPGATRAAGTERAQGAHLLFVDDDIELAPDFLRMLDATLSAQDRTGCVGPCLPGRDPGYFSRVVDLANFWSQQPPRSGPRDWLYSATLYVPAAVYHAVGGFRTDLAIGEDVDLTRRIGAASYRVLYAADLVAFHNHRRTTFARAAAYFLQNGGLARYLYPPEATLGPFSLRRVARNIGVNLQATWRTNRSIPGFFVYLPGIILMYALLSLSLEFHLHRYRLEMAVTLDGRIVTGSRVASRLLRRACSETNAGRQRVAMGVYLAAGFVEAVVPKPWRRNRIR